jgi:ATP-dependent RNA helicase DDX20
LLLYFFYFSWIYSTLPDNKQMLALSATYPEYLAQHLTAYMRNPTFLRLNVSDPALLGNNAKFYIHNRAEK